MLCCCFFDTVRVFWSRCSFKRAEPWAPWGFTALLVYLLPTPLPRLDWPSWTKSSWMISNPSVWTRRRKGRRRRVVERRGGDCCCWFRAGWAERGLESSVHRHSTSAKRLIRGALLTVKRVQERSPVRHSELYYYYYFFYRCRFFHLLGYIWANIKIRIFFCFPSFEWSDVQRRRCTLRWDAVCCSDGTLLRGPRPDRKSLLID